MRRIVGERSFAATFLLILRDHRVQAAVLVVVVLRAVDDIRVLGVVAFGVVGPAGSPSGRWNGSTYPCMWSLLVR